MGMHYVIADCGDSCMMQVRRAESPEINFDLGGQVESEKASEIQVICPPEGNHLVYRGGS